MDSQTENDEKLDMKEMEELLVKQIVLNYIRNNHK